MTYKYRIVEDVFNGPSEFFAQHTFEANTSDDEGWDYFGHWLHGNWIRKKFGSFDDAMRRIDNHKVDIQKPIKTVIHKLKD